LVVGRHKLALLAKLVENGMTDERSVKTGVRAAPFPESVDIEKTMSTRHHFEQMGPLPGVQEGSV